MARGVGLSAPPEQKKPAKHRPKPRRNHKTVCKHGLIKYLIMCELSLIIKLKDHLNRKKKTDVGRVSVI